MSDANSGYERWTTLMDRQAAGEQLTASDMAFCERFASEHPRCADELAVYAELADLDVTPNDASRALVDAALKRMEAEEAKRAFAELGDLRKRRVPTLAIGSAVAALAAIFVLYAHRAPKREDADLRAAQNLPLSRVELVYASGDVSVSGQPATVGRTLLAQGSVIETKDGSACLVIDPEINVCLAAQSRLRLSQISGGARRLDLLLGRASTRLATQPEGMSLSIVADGIASTAVGTAFSVERGAQAGAVVTTVLNGKVRVGRQGDTRIVAAHERAVMLSERTDLTSVSRIEEAPSWALLGPTILWHDPVSATLDVHGEPAQAQASLDDQPIGVAPLSSLIPVGSHHLVVRDGERVLVEREFHVTAGETVEVSYVPAPSAVPAALAIVTKAEERAPKLEARSAEQNAKLLGAAELVPPMPEDPRLAPGPQSAAQWLTQARKQMREGRFADAAASYLAIMQAFPNSETAHTVLVSLGQLQLVQLKDPQQAVASLDAYLEHGGALAEEARVARIHALAQLRRVGDEASAIDDFLAKHPHSLDVPELRARLASLRAGK
jgi:hypothetical protein